MLAGRARFSKLGLSSGETSVECERCEHTGIRLSYVIYSIIYSIASAV